MTAGHRELVNASQAARRVGRGRAVIWRWVEDGRLFKVGLDPNNLPLYDLADVRRLDETTPRRARRGQLPRRS